MPISTISKSIPGKQNSPPGFYHYQAGTAHSSQTAYFENIFSWAETEGRGGGGGGGGAEDYVIEKLTKISKGIGHKFC